MKTFNQFMLENNGRDFGGKYSKVLKRIADKDKRVDKYEHDQDGHWFILTKGWIHSDFGAKTIRADTVGRLKSELQNVIKA